MLPRHVAADYEPADTTIEAFHASSALVRIIIGARGTAKSGGCIADGYGAACEQHPNHLGKRRTKFLVLRDTYRQLETTTIPSYMKWLGSMTKLSGNYPIFAKTRCPAPGNDGTSVEMDTVFLAMDGESILDNLTSFEASFAWINEVRAIENQSIVNMVISSTGRYPSRDEEGCSRSFVVADTNPADEFHWLCKAQEDTPEGWEFFIQESPLIYTPPERGMKTFVADPKYYAPNPAATYARIQNKGYGYWLDMIPGATDAFIRTMVMGHSGTVVSGKAVYGEWWHEDCVAPGPIQVIDALPVLIGIDTSGLHPGAVFCQAHGGYVNVLAEAHAQHLPFDEFVEAVLVPIINERFRSNQLLATVDPSNPRASIGGKTAVQILANWGVQAELASTNRLNQRLGAVVRLLQRRKSMAIDPRCKMLLAGFRGRYQYPKIISSIIEAYKPLPEKNEFADCYVTGTPISTPTGSLPIESIRVGDLVSTPIGPRRVTATMSRPARNLRAVTLTDGRSFTCTAGHRLMTGRGWVRTDALQYGDLLYARAPWADLAQSISSRWSAIAGATSRALWRATASCSSGRTGITNAGADAAAMRLPCIAISGGGIEARFLPGTTSTTSTATAQTTTSPISNASTNACITKRICRSANAHLRAALNSPPQSPRLRTPPEHGTAQRRAAHGTASTLWPWRERCLPRKLWFLSSALTAGPPISGSPQWQSADSAVRTASRRAGAQAAWTTRIATAWSAAERFVSTATRSRNPAALSVAAVPAREGERVYDLTVEEAHCFYAAGVLAHNCHDAMQYAALYYQVGAGRGITQAVPQKKVMYA